MSETYSFDPDLIPDGTELEVRFEELKERTNRKNGKPFLLIKMIVRDDIAENGPFKNETICDFFSKENGTNRYKQWQMNNLVATQDLEKFKKENGLKKLDFTLEQILVFLTGKNARIKMEIVENEYGVRNKVQEYQKSQYIVKEKEKPKQVEADDFYDDVPF